MTALDPGRVARGAGRCSLRGAPAAARDFVQDQAGMFSAATVAQLNTRICKLQRADRQRDRRRHDAVARRRDAAERRRDGVLAAKRQRRADLRRARRPARHHRARSRGSAGRLVHARRACARSARRWRASSTARTTTPESPARSTRSSTSTARISAACSQRAPAGSALPAQRAILPEEYTSRCFGGSSSRSSAF